jgi:hypothetical protein
VTKARNSIAGFKLREGMSLGAKVTLRKSRMYEFIDRREPSRCRVFATSGGLNPKSFDGRGNYAIGIKEHIVFPEVNYDKVDHDMGHGCRRVHNRADRRRGPGPAQGLQLPLPSRNRAANGKKEVFSWRKSVRSRRTGTGRASWRSSDAGKRERTEGDRTRRGRCRWKSVSRHG